MSASACLTPFLFSVFAVFPFLLHFSPLKFNMRGLPKTASPWPPFRSLGVITLFFVVVAVTPTLEIDKRRGQSICLASPLLVFLDPFSEKYIRREDKRSLSNRTLLNPL